MDVVLRQRSAPYALDDLFGQWLADDPDEYSRRVAEAAILARVGALLHDLGHVPFGHTIEDDLGILCAHDKGSERFERLWRLFSPELTDALGGDLGDALRPLILSKEEVKDRPEAATRYRFVQDIVGNTICADLLDYLARDHYYTGLPAALGWRFMSGFYVTRSDHPFPDYRGRMVIRITKGGKRRADVETELFKYLRYRYELSERVLVHHAKLGADSMVGKLLETWRAALAESGDETPKATMETELLSRGDDGLLETLRDQAVGIGPASPNWTLVGKLATDLLNRRLYKRAASFSKREVAEEFYATWGGREARESLENEVEQFAELDPSTVVLWIPEPTMRLKAAEVLVDDGDAITKLASIAESGASSIYESHRKLWSLGVFVHPSLSERDRSVVLAFLQQRLGGIRWDGGESRSLPALAAEEAARRLEAPFSALARLRALAESEAQRAATFGDLVASILSQESVATNQRPLDVWMETEPARYAHPNLESAVDSDESGQGLGVRDIGQLNLRLHLADFQDSFSEPGGDHLASEMIDSDPERIYELAREKEATSSAAQRGGTGNPDATRASTALELAFKELIEESGKLL